MNKYTKNDLNNFPVIEGVIQCPTGDYTLIKNFGGITCNFGSGCSFGSNCIFGEEYTFGRGCRFGSSCTFLEGCIFGYSCIFGESCDFFVEGSFGYGCTFGESCSFGTNWIVENTIHLKAFIKVEGFGSEKRCTYFYLDTTNKIHVRCGCFLGTLEEFKEQVAETHKDTRYAQGYLKIAELVAWQFEL